jgi:hypothetical protein
MKNSIGIFFMLFCLSWTESFGQQGAKSFLVSGAFDIAKTDVPGPIRRYQLGTELNYFYLHSLSFSGGYEFNYERPNQVTLGSRFYPLEPLFIRFRGLMGQESDLALGAGYTYNFTYRFRAEGMLDYYALSKVVGIRIGIGFLIN